MASAAGFLATAVMGTLTTLPAAPPALTMMASFLVPPETAVKVTDTVQVRLAPSTVVQVLAALSMATSTPLATTARSEMATLAVTVMVDFGAGTPTATSPRSMAGGATVKMPFGETEPITETSSGVTAPGLAVIVTVPLMLPAAVGVAVMVMVQVAPG